MAIQLPSGHRALASKVSAPSLPNCQSGWHGKARRTDITTFCWLVGPVSMNNGGGRVKYFRAWASGPRFALAILRNV